MWAAFEHSWQLLSGDEQPVFSRLSVFRGGFDLAAAQQVAEATPETLSALIDKSLVRRDLSGTVSICMNSCASMLTRNSARPGKPIGYRRSISRGF